VSQLELQYYLRTRLQRWITLLLFVSQLSGAGGPLAIPALNDTVSGFSSCSGGFDPIGLPSQS
jgi:hypothetical protein